MILSMRMHNIALIEELTLEFGEGLHVMTGETGAGKAFAEMRGGSAGGVSPLSPAGIVGFGISGEFLIFS